MKREFLKSLELSDELIDKIMAEHGKDVEKHKTELSTLTAERDGLKTQIDEAGKQIKAFEGMDIEAVKKSASEWETKAKTAEEAAKAEIAKLKFDYALDGALIGAKAKNAKAVKALLDTELLKLAEDGSIAGLKEQLEKLQTDEKSSFLFESEKSGPKIVTGGNSQTINSADPITAAIRRGAGLPQQKEN